MVESESMTEASGNLCSPLRLYGWLGLAAVAAIGLFYICFGQIVVEKLLTALAMPLGLIWIMLGLLCIELLRRKLFVPFLFAGFIWCFCTIAGNGYVSASFVQDIERQYHVIQPLTMPPMEVVVLLGGGAGEAPNGQAQVNGAGDRIVLAARMFNRGTARQIVCTGATITELSTQERQEADRAKILLQDMGVPETAIQKLGGRNTHEEMQAVVEKFGTQKRIGILTSAWHLPRAMRLAEAAGINAVPVPAGFRSYREDEEKDPIPIAQKILSLIPDQGALSVNSMLAKEMLARLVNR